MDRFLRIERLLGKEKVAKLKKAKVTVIGLGAVGSYAVEGLARAGVGNFLLIDCDVIQPSNINRQLFALESTLGREKSAAAVARVKDINPKCNAAGRTLFVHTDTLPDVFAEVPDLVIDAIDSLAPKVELLTYCYRHKIPVISSMGAAVRTDPSHVKVADIMDATSCPLLKYVKKHLRKNGVGHGLTCVYSTEKTTYTFSEKDLEATEEIGYVQGRPRKALGSLPTLTGIFGLTIANTAIQQLTA